MKISVITINYNNLNGLKKTLNSVWEQNCTNFEHLVIDGLSTDGSAEYLKDVADKFSYWTSEKDSGIYDAMNKGIVKASGDYLLFLNSGDVFYQKDTLQKVLPLLDGSASFYYGNLILQKAGLKEEHVSPSELDLDFMLNSTFWHPAVFIQASLFYLYGLYRTDFKITGDYEFFIRCLLKPEVHAKQLPYFICVFDGEGRSNDPELKKVQELERKKSWLLNVSPIIYEALKAYNRFTRSRYSGWIKKIQYFRKKNEGF